MKHFGLYPPDSSYVAFCTVHGWYQPSCFGPGCGQCTFKQFLAQEEAEAATKQKAKLEAEKAEEKRLKLGCQTALQLLYASTFAQAMPFEDFMALLKLAKREFEALK